MWAWRKVNNHAQLVDQIILFTLLHLYDAECFMKMAESDVVCKWISFNVVADYMPLNPPEDEDDTVVNIIYPLEPPVIFS